VVVAENRRDFSTVAALALGVVLLTGAYLSLLHVGDWAALISTAYGQALLSKLALAGVAMLIGAYNLIVTKPQLDAAIDQPDQAPRLQRRFRRVVIIEAVAALLVLAAAGVLTNLPRSKDPQPQAAAGALTLTTRADEVDAALAIDPARSGLANFALRFSQNGQAIDAADATVSLRFTYLVRSLGTTKADAVRADDGSFVASGPYLSLPGEWQIEAAVRRPDAFDVFAAYRVKVNLDGAVSVRARRRSWIKWRAGCRSTTCPSGAVWRSGWGCCGCSSVGRPPAIRCRKFCCLSRR
jgi:uncharacterized membrane protein